MLIINSIAAIVSIEIGETAVAESEGYDVRANYIGAEWVNMCRCAAGLGSSYGSLLSSITGIESDYRHLVCGSYITFYRIDRMNVFIDRILYGRRDYLRILFPDISDEQ